MMLPTDICLTTDSGFRPYVEKYAADQEAFFRDFSAALAKLLANGTPEARKFAWGAMERGYVTQYGLHHW